MLPLKYNKTIVTLSNAENNAILSPAEKRKQDKALTKEAETLYYSATKGIKTDGIGILATQDQINAVTKAAEQNGIDPKKFTDAIKKYKTIRENELRDLFYKQYRKAHKTITATPEPSAPAKEPEQVTADADQHDTGSEEPTAEEKPDAEPQQDNTADDLQAKPVTESAPADESEPGQIPEDEIQPEQDAAEPEPATADADQHDTRNDGTTAEESETEIKIRDGILTAKDRIDKLTSESAKEMLNTEVSKIEMIPDITKRYYAVMDLAYHIKTEEDREQNTHITGIPKDAHKTADAEIGELSIIGFNATVEETAEYYKEKEERTQYRNIPAWDREIIGERNDSVWFNDYFLQKQEYRDPANISKITTELSNGFRYAAESRNFLVYDISDKPQGKRTTPKYFWRAWTGTYWKPAVWEPQNTAKLVIKAIEREIGYFSMMATNTTNETDQKILKSAGKELIQHYNDTSKKNGIKHMIELSAAEPGLSADINKIYDRDLIGCNNGIIDTKKAKFYPVNEITDELKNRYPIHHIDCNFIVNGPKPKRFIEFLYTVFTDNTSQDVKELENRERCRLSAKVFLRLLGYSLIAGNPERKMLFLYGKGRNGKSTLMGILQNILGDEYGEGNSSELYAKSSDAPAPRITEALTRRILSFAEISDADIEDIYAGRISLDIVKLLTGEQTTNQFRGMGTYDGRIDILCLPIAQTNNFPQFNRTPDRAFLDRLITVPFLHRLTDEEIDPSIKEKILKEKDLIFSLLVNECFTYRKGIKDNDGMYSEKPGLIPVPDYWGSEQTKIMVGPRLYEYISKRFTKSANPNNIDFTSIVNDYIHWLLINKADDPRPFKDERRSYDTSGDKQPAYTIKKGEKSNLKKALAIFGYEEHESNSKSYYNVELSQETLIDWEPNPQY